MSTSPRGKNPAASAMLLDYKEYFIDDFIN